MANSPKGYGNLHKNTSGAKNKGSDAFASYGGSIDTFVANPKNLGKHSSSQIYDWLKKIKMDPKPLGQGSIKGIPYEDGGGYRVNWGGDKLFQYHPPGGHHGGSAYYKISNGIDGVKRYTLKGELKDD